MSSTNGSRNLIVSMPSPILLGSRTFHLRRERIPLIGEDVGGHHGRTVKFELNSGRLLVKAIGKTDREI